MKILQQRFLLYLAAAATLCFGSSALAQEDAGAEAPSFKEGDVITFEQLDALRRYLPDEFWNNRDFFFYEGMQLEIGPFYRDYSPPDAYTHLTELYKGQPKIGPDNSRQDYIGGQPFPMEEIDCATDPQAAVKIMWNFVSRWAGSAGHASFYYS
jgi:hypothetical protein